MKLNFSMKGINKWLFAAFAVVLVSVVASITIFGAETTIETKAETTAKTETTVKVETTAKPQTTVEAETTAKPETTVKTETTAKPQTTVKPETTIEAKPEIKPETPVVTTKKAKVTSDVKTDELRVRSEPNTSSSIVFKLSGDDNVIIHSQKDGEEVTEGNKVWYYIEYNGQKGYAYSKFITIVPDVVIPEDSDFETYMTSQGFPDTYKQALRELHAKYPNWVFKAQKVEYDFGEAVEKEKPLSLVHSSSISSWKSMEGDAYDWTLNTWRGFDGVNWVRASGGIIAHYMDPRNFLGENSIFLFLEQSYDGKIQTIEGVKKIIANTFMQNDVVDADGTTLKYAEAIYNAGKTYGVNPYVFAAMLVIEQGVNGTSGLISGTYPGYEGYYNYFNIGAYAQGNMDAIQRGLWYAKGGNVTDPAKLSNLRPWNTRLKSINGGAVYYSSGYITKGQNTLYLKRFNVCGDNAFTHQYMTNIQGAAQEALKLAQGYSAELRDAALSFYIPVYKNMPETPAQKPTGGGAPNMKLSSLTVENFELTPDFNPDVLEYSLVVPHKVNSVVVKAVAMEESATVTGVGTLTLTENKHVFEIKVKAGNGDMRIYKLTVAKEAEKEDLGVVTFTNKYAIENLVIKGVAPNMTIAQFQSAFLSAGNISVTNSAGVAKTAESTIASGDVIKVFTTKNVPYAEYKVSVKGDANGDGKININDLLKVRNHILGTDTLSGVLGLAADVDGGGVINISDLLKVRNHILGTGTIS